MKKTFKRILASLMVTVMILTVAPLSGFVGLELPDLGSLFSTKADAAEYEVGDLITFGSYPQSEVEDTSLLSALNSLSLSWASYGYYSGTGDWDDGMMTSGDYMKYADVTYGGEKYRAVTFTEYRPKYTGYDNDDGTYQDDNGYYTNTVYWFKFEPLEWRVLDPDEGFIMCESIIDSQPYSNTVYYNGSKYYQNTSCTTYANDYATSSIRDWLNDDFYHTAFTEAEKGKIQNSVQDNSCPFNSAYDSDTTYDKIFLLSYDEVINSDYGFSANSGNNDTERRAQGTDYAKAQGLYVYNSSGSAYHGNSWWWLRSPGYYSNCACGVYYYGYAYCSYCYVNYTFEGVRPALKFNLQSVTDPDTPDEPDDFTESIKIGADRFSFGQDMTGVAGDTFDALLVYISKENDINDLTITSSNSAVATVGTPNIDTGDYITEENEFRATLPITLKSSGTTTITVTTPDGTSTGVNVVVTDDRAIAILSTNQSFTLEVGEKSNFAFGLMKDGLLEDDWKKMAVVVSDPTVVSFGCYKTTDYGYSIDVTGLKEGSTNVTVTDTETGISTSFVLTVCDDYTKTYSYAIDNIASFHPNHTWEDHLNTNIYDLNGLYVDNYISKKIGDTYYVTFDAYNRKFHTAAVDIYDADGNWLRSEEIEKNSNIDSLYDTVEQSIYMVIGGSWGTYQHPMQTKHTPISIEVPDGGYFTISNNIAESPGCFLYNACEIFYRGVSTIIDCMAENDVEKPFIDMISGEIKNDEITRKMFYGLFISAADSEIRRYSENILKGDAENGCESISALLENMLSSLDIDIKHCLELAMGVGESALEKLFGPAGLALKGCFSFADSVNFATQVKNLADSTDEPYVVVYSEVEQGFINPHGVYVDTKGNMDTEATLQVFRISNNNAVDTVLDSSNSYESHELYNICFVKDDQLVQPNGKVKVYIPIPEGLVGNTCVIYRQETDGSWTTLDTTIEGNYLTFETDHFSLYAVVGNRAELKIASLPDKLTYLPNQTIDTTGLVLELNGEKITDGYLCELSVTGNVGTQVVTVRYGVATVEFSVEVVDEEPQPEPTPKPDPEPIPTGKVSGVSIDDISMNYKASATIVPNITVDEGVEYTVTYSSSDEGVVSVDENGNLTTNGTGSATITVTVTDEYGNTVTDTCEVNVSYNWWQWILVIVLFGWIWY